MNYKKKTGLVRFYSILPNLCKFRLHNNIELLCKVVNSNNIYLGLIFCANYLIIFMVANTQFA